MAAYWIAHKLRTVWPNAVPQKQAMYLGVLSLFGKRVPCSLIGVEVYDWVRNNTFPSPNRRLLGQFKTVTQFLGLNDGFAYSVDLKWLRGS